MDSKEKLVPCDVCSGDPQPCWEDVGDKKWYCKQCWDKWENNNDVATTTIQPPSPTPPLNYSPDETNKTRDDEPYSEELAAAVKEHTTEEDHQVSLYEEAANELSKVMTLESDGRIQLELSATVGQEGVHRSVITSQLTLFLLEVKDQMSGEQAGELEREETIQRDNVTAEAVWAFEILNDELVNTQPVPQKQQQGDEGQKKLLNVKAKKKGKTKASTPEPIASSFQLTDELLNDRRSGQTFFEWKRSKEIQRKHAVLLKQEKEQKINEHSKTILEQRREEAIHIQLKVLAKIEMRKEMQRKRREQKANESPLQPNELWPWAQTAGPGANSSPFRRRILPSKSLTTTRSPFKYSLPPLDFGQ